MFTQFVMVLRLPLTQNQKCGIVSQENIKRLTLSINVMPEVKTGIQENGSVNSVKDTFLEPVKNIIFVVLYL